jgi:hypothetical protein
MNWTVLEGTADLHALEAASGDRGFLVLKHSTRCPVSSQAALSLQRWEAPADTPPCSPDTQAEMASREVAHRRELQARSVAGGSI